MPYTDYLKSPAGLLILCQTLLVKPKHIRASLLLAFGFQLLCNLYILISEFFICLYTYIYVYGKNEVAVITTSWLCQWLQNYAVFFDEIGEMTKLLWWSLQNYAIIPYIYLHFFFRGTWRFETFIFLFPNSFWIAKFFSGLKEIGCN